MAGTASDRGEEQARVRRSESNTYYDGKTGAASPMKEGFGPKKRTAKDPTATSAGTSAPNGRSK